MARALARGWGDPVLVSDGGSGRAKALAQELGGEALHSNVEVAECAHLIVRCHKPAQFEMVSRELAGHAKAVGSVLAGIDTGQLRNAYEVPVFRIVPNTPVEARRGVMCYAPEREVDAGLEADVLELFGRLGTVVKVPEKLMGAAGALMGVGPAYQALLVEAQVDAGVATASRPRSPAGSSPRRWPETPRCSRRATTTRSRSAGR